jgi:hypothetical protein
MLICCKTATHSAIHARPISHCRAQLNKRRARITNGRNLMASEIMRGGFHIANGILQLANGSSDTRMIGLLGTDGLCRRYRANGSAQHGRQGKSDSDPLHEYCSFRNVAPLLG